MVKTAILETPFKNDDLVIKNENILYTNLVSRVLMLEHKISPLFFHTLYTQHLDDDCETERNLGLEMSFHHHTHVDMKIVAIDRGISTGMGYGIKDAMKKGVTIKFLSLDPEVHERIQDKNLIEVQSILSEMKPNGLGDLTHYRKFRKKELADVKKIMDHVFSPIISHTVGTEVMNVA